MSEAHQGRSASIQQVSTRAFWWTVTSVTFAAVAAPLLLAATQIGIDPRFGHYLPWAALQALICLLATICFGLPIQAIWNGALSRPQALIVFGIGLIAWAVTATLAWDIVIVHLVAHLAIPAVLLGCASLAFMPLNMRSARDIGEHH